MPDLNPSESLAYQLLEGAQENKVLLGGAEVAAKFLNEASDAVCKMTPEERLAFVGKMSQMEARSPMSRFTQSVAEGITENGHLLGFSFTNGWQGKIYVTTDKCSVK